MLSSGDFSDPGIELVSCTAGVFLFFFLPTGPPGKPTVLI